MSTTIQTNGIVEVARYASDLTPISRVEESLVSIQTQAESFPDQFSDMIVPLEVERDALAKAWEDLKTSLKEQGKEDKYFDSVPGDFNSLVQTARTAQKELLTKKGRKSKEYFNKFCEKAWAHKTVLDFFPSSNEYVAVFCGVIKTLVKASVNYTTITEGFAQALDEITEHVDFAKRQVVNMPSSHTISALAGLYKETFLYLKEFTEWFTKKTRRRLLKAFDGDIYDKYKEQIERIRRSSQNVYQVVMVETIQNMQRSRPTDETLEQERRKLTDELVKRMELSMENLWNKFNATIQFRETGLRATGMLEGVYRSEQWQQGQLLLQQQLLPDEPTVELQKGLPVTLQSFKQEGAGQYTRTSLITSAETLETFIMGNSTELLKALPPSPFATIPVAIKLQEWLASKESAMLWAHGLPTYGYPTGFSALAGSLINAALASDNKVIFHFCEPPQSNQLSEGLTLEQAGMISTVYSLICQLVKLLPAELTIETDLSSDRFMELQSPMNGWNSAIEILERLFELSPPVLICVIDGVSDLDYDQGAPLFQDFLGVLKRRAERARLNGHFLKCLFTSNGFSKTLDENLGEEQIVSDLEPPLAPGTFGYAGPGQRYIETSNWGGDDP